MFLSTLRPGIGAAVVLAAAVTLPTLLFAQQQSLYEHDERLRGLVRPSREVNLGAPIDGLVGEILVQEHQMVQEGDLVARMDDGVQQVAVEAARIRAEDETEIYRQSLLLEEAEIQLERTIELEEVHSARDWEVRESRLQRDATEAGLERAKHEQRLAQQQLRVEEERLERLQIKAPFDGMVIRIGSDVGESLRLGDGIMQLMALDPLEAQLYLPVELYGELEVGREYRLLGEAPVNRELVGTLKSVEPVIDSASHTFRVLFTIDNTDLELPVGFTVRLPWPQPIEAAQAE